MKTITSSQEAVALSGDRTDEAGPAPVFPELFAEIANVTIHDVALGDVIECGELGFEIASDGQRDRRDPAIRDALADEVERFGAFLVDVHQEEVRAPLTKLVEPRLRRCHRARHVNPMVESEGNKVRE